MKSKPIHHPGGFVEIDTTEGLLIFTEDEYAKAFRRGQSVVRNRTLKVRSILSKVGLSLWLAQPVN